MKYEDVKEAISNRFPQFEIDDLNGDLPYIVAGDFARFLLDSFSKGDMETLSEGLDFIEKLHHSEFDKTRELATVGYLEGIQNVWGNNDVNPELIFDYLGAESKKWWFELNKFWNGEIKYLGAFFENK